MRDMEIIYTIYSYSFCGHLWLLGAHCSYDNPLDVGGGGIPFGL